MTEKAVDDPVDSVIRRQSVSEANHVNRIRSASIKRLSVLLSSTDILSSIQDSDTNQEPSPNEEHTDERMSMSDFSNKRKSHQNCLESLDELRLKISNQNLVDSDHITDQDRKHSIIPNVGIRRLTDVGTHRVTEKERKSSVPGNMGSGQRQTTESQTRSIQKTKSDKSRKTSSIKNDINVFQKRRKSSALRKSSINTNKIGTNETAKPLASKRRRSISMKKEPSKNNVKQSEFDKLLQVCDSKGNITSGDFFSERDSIVLKWVHEIDCPISEKEKSYSDFSEIKRSPIRILKKVPKESVNKSKEKLLNKRQSSSVKINSKLSTEKKDKSQTSVDNEILTDGDFQETKREADSTEKVTKHVPDVEMHVSELGKLQIILDSKNISPEDAAIIIWIDNIPKSFFTPEYSRRLSLAPEPDLETLGIPTKTIKSLSSSELEDMPSPKPDIYFPPVTILENTAIDSRFGLRRLHDYDDSVLYKRCNIDHVEWGFTQEQ